MDNFLEIDKLPKLIQEEIKVWIDLKQVHRLLSIILKPPTKKRPGLDSFNSKFYQHLKKC